MSRSTNELLSETDIVGLVDGSSKAVTSEMIVWCDQCDKTDFVIDFLSRSLGWPVLIFVQNSCDAEYLEGVLMQNNFSAVSIHGDSSQLQREDAFYIFNTGRSQILVATDEASIGFDIPNAVQVINYDLPWKINEYVHRIGRSGRVGNVRHALSLMNDENLNIVKKLLVENEQELPIWLNGNVADFVQCGSGDVAGAGGIGESGGGGVVGRGKSENVDGRGGGGGRGRTRNVGGNGRGRGRSRSAGGRGRGGGGRERSRSGGGRGKGSSGRRGGGGKRGGRGGRGRGRNGK